MALGAGARPLVGAHDGAGARPLVGAHDGAGARPLVGSKGSLVITIDGTGTGVSLGSIAWGGWGREGKRSGAVPPSDPHA